MKFIQPMNILHLSLFHFRLHKTKIVISLLCCTLLFLFLHYLGLSKFIPTLSAFLCVYASFSTFSSYKNKTSFLPLSLPSQPLEKLLERWINILVLLPFTLYILHFLTYFITINIQSHSLFDTPQRMALSSFFPLEMFSFIFLFGTGSLYFKKLSTLKTALTYLILIGYSVILFLLMMKLAPETGNRWGKSTLVLITKEHLQQNKSEKDQDIVLEEESVKIDIELEMKSFIDIVFPTNHQDKTTEFNFDNPDLLNFYKTIDTLFAIISILYLLFLSWVIFREHELKA